MDSVAPPIIIPRGQADPNRELDLEVATRFRTNLRKLRDERGLTQQELADLAGYENSQSISNVERGVFAPRMTTLFRLARALSVEASVLLGF